MVGAAGLRRDLAQVRRCRGVRGDAEAHRLVPKDHAARLQAGQRLADIPAVVLSVRQQHDHPVRGAGMPVALHETVREAQRVGHRRPAAGLQGADERGQSVDVASEVLIAGHRVGAVATERQHRNFYGSRARSPAECGDRGLLGGVDLRLRIARADLVSHASGGVDQEQEAAAGSTARLGHGERCRDQQPHRDGNPRDRVVGAIPRLRRDH